MNVEIRSDKKKGPARKISESDGMTEIGIGMIDVSHANLGVRGVVLGLGPPDRDLTLVPIENRGY